MFTDSIADHMRVVKPLAPAGYLQAHAFNLDRNHFAMTPGTPSAHGRRAVWRGTIPGLFGGTWTLRPAPVCARLRTERGESCLCRGHLAVTEPEFMRISLGDI